MADNLKLFGTTYYDVPGLKVQDVDGNEKTFIRPAGTKQISQNGTADVKNYEQANVNVPNSYDAGDEGKVVQDGALVSQSSQNINSNGTYDTTTKNQVVVSVPNTYTAGDEGKVVNNGALVAQTSDTCTSNGVVDTTLINSLDVNVSGSSYTDEQILLGHALTGDIEYTLQAQTTLYLIIGHHDINKLTINLNGYQFNTQGATVQYCGAKTYVVNGDFTVQCAPYYIAGGSNEGYMIVHRGVVTRFMQYSLRDPNLTLLDITYNGAGSNQGFENGAAYSSNKFATLIIRGNTLFPLKNIGALTQCDTWKSGGTGGTLYVPSALKSTYESNTNWATILGYSNNQIKTIEGSIYDGYYADGTPIS